ncbi:MAG: hypothetical protein JWO57_2045 [Pseudonocardiales bacterium]|jgi:hypothetical protein|nr:hypothetical protein [Pseudonocardiales bacterium]
MPVTSELTTLHRVLGDLRSVVGSVRSRYGDIPAVRRLLGDVDRIDLDASELDHVPPPPESRPVDVQVLDDRPIDPSLWADADDEGLGGYHRDGSR